jgi:TPR repeat protein
MQITAQQVDSLCFIPIVNVLIGGATVVSNSVKCVNDVAQIIFAVIKDAYYRRENRTQEEAFSANQIFLTQAKDNLGEHVTFIGIGLLRISYIGHLILFYIRSRRTNEILPIQPQTFNFNDIGQVDKPTLKTVQPEADGQVSPYTIKGKEKQTEKEIHGKNLDRQNLQRPEKSVEKKSIEKAQEPVFEEKDIIVNTQQDLEALMLQAEKKGPASMLKLGVLYKKGYQNEHVNIEPNAELAVKWLLLAAGKKIKKAYWELGEHFYLQNRYDLALKWFNLCQGEGRSYYYLHLMYEIGQDVEQNSQQAKQFLEKAAEQKDQHAVIKLAQLKKEAKKKEAEEKIPAGLKQLICQAEQKDILSQAKLGLMYKHGYQSNELKVEPSEELANKWLEGVDQKKIAEAYGELGCSFYSAKDYGQALSWLNWASQLGNGRADYHLHFMYEKGEGVEPSLENAQLFFEKAFEKNYPPAIMKARLVR